jgi:hypothetical protein
VQATCQKPPNHESVWEMTGIRGSLAYGGREASGPAIPHALAQQTEPARAHAQPPSDAGEIAVDPP